MKRNCRMGKNIPAKGQLQLEAIICLAAFLAILGLFLAALNEAGTQANEALNALEAKAQAELCCLAADISYASGVSEISEEVQCTAQGSKVESETGGKKKSCESIAPEIRLVQEGEKSVLEVALNEHYR
ncbi:MAG: hypothetical protein WC634_03580 [archaeon]